ncbi:hypothetical protein [Cupriavidus basilensis]|uniref:hypothetical protein n=1 Tax=Cupriavidus basilensis TaxID=68895 RepID=UPI0039F6F925
MDRQIVYPGQIPLETDLLNTNKYAMIALAKMTAAMLGTATVVNGLGCVPTGPASLQVVVNPGEIYGLANIDATAYSSLPADTTHSILKQGISLDPVTLSCPAPATAGQSVNYLIQAAYQDSDTGLITLPYYNASNPTQAWSGPGGSGAQQATARKGVVSIQVKAGVAATTSTQTTPAPDAGYSGLWVVTVANGQTTITSASIAQAPNAPILPADLLHAIQQNALTTAVDTGTANAYAVSYSPPITALTDGMVLWFKAKTANNSASTLNVNGLGAQPMVGGAHSALQGGEIVAGGKAQVVWRADISSFVLLECTGGALQVAPATQPQHAVQLTQASGIVGSARNAQMLVAAASSTATFTADELIVESALGGARYCLAGVNQTINLATTGAGGMDGGTPPANGYVGIYEIYNPTTNSRALLGRDATSVLLPDVYGGANMPAGYTASALVAVWPTDGAGKLVSASMIGRRVLIPTTGVLSSSAQQASLTPLSLAGAVPKNARHVRGWLSALCNTVGTAQNMSLSSAASALGSAYFGAAASLAGVSTIGMVEIDIVVPQTVYYTAQTTGGIATFSISVMAYDF